MERRFRGGNSRPAKEGERSTRLENEDAHDIQIPPGSLMPDLGTEARAKLSGIPLTPAIRTHAVYPTIDSGAKKDYITSKVYQTLTSDLKG